MEVLTQIEDFLTKIDYNQNTAMIWGGDFNVTCDNNNNNNIICLCLYRVTTKPSDRSYRGTLLLKSVS